jgi:hypothetical protein
VNVSALKGMIDGQLDTVEYRGLGKGKSRDDLESMQFERTE